MSDEKLSSEQVPTKFAEWLLAMGCPPEDVPPLDKIAQMCRGQYYMVWRSLMEHVGPKDKVLSKRLQVFNDDVAKCKKNNLDANMPEELFLWNKQSELKQQVADAESRLAEEKERLNQLVDKVSSKLAHRNLSRKRLQDAQRRSWLLQQVAAELRERRQNLLETKTIADSLCCVDDSKDIESKLEKCLTISRSQAPGRAGVSLLSVNPAACSSTASAGSDHDAEEQVSSLVKCRGDAVFRQLYERRAGLCTLAAARDHVTLDKDRTTPQSVLAHTAALHCNLALETVKNRVHIKQINKRLAAAISELNNRLSGEACEFLVVLSERAHSSARATALKALCDELRERDGVFAAPAQERDARPAAVHSLDKAIISKRDELKRLIASAATVERKTQHVKASLMSTFNSFHETERLEAASQMSIANPQDTISSIRQFYDERRDKKPKKMDLSMDLDISESCSYELTDNGSPKFIDELRMYLKKFRLEKNRKLVLESGEKVWVFETVSSTLSSLHSKWQNADITTSVVCPSVSLAHSLARLAKEVASKAELESVVRSLEEERKHDLDLDISSITEDEQKTLEKIKRRLNENILNLHKTGKTLTLGIENLGLWSANDVKQYISDTRSVDGRTFKEYEREYQECSGI